MNHSSAAVTATTFADLNARTYFIIALCVATLIPFLFVPLSTGWKADATSMVLLFGIINFAGGNGHVGMTYFYYSEPRFRGFFRERPLRYFVIPAVIIIGTGLLYQFSNAATRAYVLLGYFAWQTYHYQKQNYGILSFVSAGKSGRVLWIERALLELGVFAGILGLVHVNQLDKGTHLGEATRYLWQIGLNLYLFIPMATLLVVCWNWKLYVKNWSRLAALISFTFFYLPTFLFEDARWAILGYALAHGLQYYIFMYFVAQNETSSQTRHIRLGTLVASCLAVGGLLTLMSDKALWGGVAEGVFGAYLGLVMAHFVIDAGVWRLREPFQRTYLKEAFSFLFSSKPGR